MYYILNVTYHACICLYMSTFVIIVHYAIHMIIIILYLAYYLLYILIVVGWRSSLTYRKEANDTTTADAYYDDGIYSWMHMR